MKAFYLVLTVLGFVAPNIYVAKVSMETGNILLWLDPVTTFQSMFINDIAAAFSIDLLLVVVVFFLWSFREAKKHEIKNLWLYWVLTMMFGLSGALPMFLYSREKAIESK